MNKYDNGARIQSTLISPTAPISEAVVRLEKTGIGVLTLCGTGMKLIGLLTDGDVRRAIMRGISLDDPCKTIASLTPITVENSIAGGDALHLMNKYDIDHLPVVDGEGKLLKLLIRKDLVLEEKVRESARKRLDSVIISPDISISDAISCLDQAGTGALLLCSGEGKLVGILTDGDIRRAILKGLSFQQSCTTIANRDPITAKYPTLAEDILDIMDQHDISHLPVVDQKGTIKEFYLRRDLVNPGQMGLSAVVMAGGFGKRLLPLTKQVPKPMLPVGDKPLLELTIEQLRCSGIKDMSLTTHYLPENIVEHFGNGDAYGVRLSYAKEDHPMGTAGGLKLLKRPDSPFLVINGDILTGVSFQEMFRYHRKNNAEITVGVRKYEIQVPFGVVECDDARITGLKEKPSLAFFINAGIYILDPKAWHSIPDGQRFDMTDLIQKLLDEGRTVVSFPIIEYWLDVGRHDDYLKAQDDVRNGKISQQAGNQR